MRVTLVLALIAVVAASCAKAQDATRPAMSASAFSGVDPTGSSDSTAGLAAALAAASGGELDLPAGTYLVSTLAPPANTRVVGLGVGVTTIKRLATATQVYGNPLVVVPTGGDIENLTIDLNSPALGNWWSGIGPAGSTANVILRNLAVANASFNGLHWDDSAGAWTHVGTIIENVKVTNAGWIGAKLYGIRGGHASNVNVVSSGWNAIDVDRNSQFQLLNPRSTKAVSPPIIFAGANNPFRTTSSTRNTIAGRGALAFTVGTGLNYAVGKAIYAYATDSPSNFIYGTVARYDAGTGALTIAASASGGAGSFGAWTLVAEDGLLLFLGPTNSEVTVDHPVAIDNRHAVSDGIGIGEVGTTSATTVTPGTGSKTFTVARAGLAYIGGQSVTIISQADPTATWMRGTVTSYSGATLIVNVASFAGSGAHADWSINTEPGPVTVTGAVIVHAGLFGFDMASNVTLDGADIENAASRGLELGLDLGGRMSNASASNVRIHNTGTSAAPGQGVYFGNEPYFQSFENIRLSGIQVYDDQPTRTTQFGVEVDTTDAKFSNVTLDNASSHYSQVARSPYFEFGGGLDPRLNGPAPRLP
jgi:hypothetical protein